MMSRKQRIASLEWELEHIRKCYSQQVEKNNRLSSELRVEKALCNDYRKRLCALKEGVVDGLRAAKELTDRVEIEP